MSSLFLSPTAEHILGLAKAHNVSYVKTAGDALASVFTRLSDDDVDFDQIGLLVIALVRAGVVTNKDALLLHAEYLREKLNVRSIR